MKIHFYKFHGTGNDFVILDNRKMFFKKDMTDLYQFLCDRHFGIGADGVMLFQEKKEYDFEMVYFNADGRESTMCGNGGRCLVKFAEMMIEKKSYY
ncbi:MAG TPA: diaminopimelate epimerase, partial [Chitinophagales bacterium]|nr:diaminopimelate epimerase [Chitinophagales bacterium]